MSDRIRVATRKGLFTLTRTNGRWQLNEPAFIGDPVSSVLDDPRDRTVYAALNLGHFGVKLRRSRNDGASWDEITAPIYPEQPAGTEGAPWKLIQIWSLETGGRDQPGRLWAGTIPGGLFRSDDHGDSWALVRGLWDRPERVHWAGGGYDYAGIHSILVHPADSSRISVAVSTGGVWSSDDDAATWRIGGRGMVARYMPPDQQDEPNAQDVHRVVQCNAQPDVLWTQHHSGIFRSVNRAASWTEVHAPLSSFGFAVVVHPQDANTAWFVPAVKDERRIPVEARLAVTRTRDGGKTFDVLRAGLPEGPCYDLAYRHGLDISADGTRLVMATTTGNLWVSENQGDSWQSVSAHLPPVYAVRFAPPS